MPRLTKKYIAGKGWGKYPALKVRGPDGQGLFLFGERPLRRGPGGQGIKPFGTGIGPLGGDAKSFFKGIEKGFQKVGRDTKKFLTSKPFKSAIRLIRNTASPIVRKMIPELISRGADATALIPGVGPAVQPFAKALTPLATKGVLKGLDLGEDLAKKHGYGNPLEAVKYTKAQLGKQNHRRALDMRDLDTFARVAQSAPIRGRGLRPL
jgi:hypothetical protein